MSVAKLFAGITTTALNSAPVNALVRLFRRDLWAGYIPNAGYPKGQFFKYSREDNPASIDRTFWIGGLELVLSQSLRK